MRIKSDDQMKEEVALLKFPDDIMGVMEKTLALSTNISKEDLVAFESFSGEPEQNIFILEKIAQYYQFQEKDYNKAIYYWTKLTDYDCVEKVEALINLTGCFTNTNNYPDAFGSIEFASAINKDQSLIPMINQIKADLVAKATTPECTQIIKIDKKMEEGDFAGALDECEVLLSMNANSKSAHFRKAQIYSLLGDVSSARAEFLKA